MVIPAQAVARRTHHPERSRRGIQKNNLLSVFPNERQCQSLSELLTPARHAGLDPASRSVRSRETLDSGSSPE